MSGSRAISIEKYATATSIVVPLPLDSELLRKGTPRSCYMVKGKYRADAHPEASRSAQEAAHSKRLMATELFSDRAFIAEARDRVGSDRAGASCQSRSGQKLGFTKR